MNHLNILLLLLTFSSLSYCQSASWLPKIVWTYLEAPLTENDQLLMSFFNNHKQMLKGWEYRLLNRDNMWKWLDQIPGLRDNFFSVQFQSQTDQRRSELIRLAIMHHYGGVWMDFKMILTENFDWIFDLKNNQLVQNKYGDHPNIFILYSPEHGDKDETFDNETNQNFMLYPSLQIFFMAAKPDNQFTKDWMEYFVLVLKNSYKKYGTDNKKSWVIDFARQKNLKTGDFPQALNFECSISSSVLLQMKQEQLDIGFEKNQLKQRQLAVKNYKIWLMGTAETAHAIHKMARGSEKHIVNILAQSDINYLKTKKFHPRYFVMIYNQILNYLRIYLMSKQMISQTICQEYFYIFQNSILYQYLLKYNTKFYQNQVVKYTFNRNCITPNDLKQYIQKKKQLKELQQKQSKKKEEQQIKYQSRLKKMIEEAMKKQNKQAKQILDQQKNIFQQQLIEKQQKIDKMKRILIDSEEQVKFHKLLNQIIAPCLFISSIVFLFYCCENKKKEHQFSLEQTDKQQNSSEDITPTKELQ